MRAGGTIATRGINYACAAVECVNRKFDEAAATPAELARFSADGDR